MAEHDLRRLPSEAIQSRLADLEAVAQERGGFIYGRLREDGCVDVRADGALVRRAQATALRLAGATYELTGNPFAADDERPRRVSCRRLGDDGSQLSAVAKVLRQGSLWLLEVGDERYVIPPRSLSSAF